MRLSHKLLLCTVASAGLVAGVGQWSSRVAEKSLLDAIHSESMTLSRATMDEIDWIFQNRLTECTGWVYEPGMQAVLERSNKEYELLDDVDGYLAQRDVEWRASTPEAVAPIVSELLGNPQSRQLRAHLERFNAAVGHSALAEVFVTNRFGGNVVQNAKTSDFRQDDEVWWQEARDKGMYVGEFAFDESAGVLSSEICTRIDDAQGRMAGVLKAVVDIREVVRILDRRLSKLDPTANLLLTTKDGAIVYSARENLVCPDESYDNPLDGLAVEEGKDETALLVVNNVRYVASRATSRGYGSYPGLGGRLILLQRESTLTAPVLTLRRRLSVIVGIALGVALTAGLWLSVSLSRRTMRLMGAVEAVGQGNLGHTLSDSGSDELAMLCKSFNRMTKDLRQQRLEIGEQAQSISVQNVQLAEEIRQRIESEEQRLVYEVRLRQAQKLESVGQLAAGIAHEINTPTQFVADNMRFFKDALAELSGMLRLCQQLATEPAGSERAAELADEVRASAKAIDLGFLLDELPSALEDSLGGLDRVATIVGAMRSFSHPGATERELVNVNAAIESTLTVSQNAWKHVAEVELALDPDLPLVPCVQSELSQVILNILINAAHAIEAAAAGPRKGLIRIITRVVEGCAEIRLEDNGHGIPPEIRHRVFDPFFTTKEVGKGMGQGLAISHAVIERHGGKIEFESVVGRGTTFIIRLPLEAPVVAPA